MYGVKFVDMVDILNIFLNGLIKQRNIVQLGVVMLVKSQKLFLNQKNLHHEIRDFI